MPSISKSQTRPSVPRGTDDPIQYLMDKGASLPQLAVAWGFKHTDAVYRLKRYAYAPSLKSAERMAKSFGWTAGQVIDHWVERVERRKLA